MLEHVPEQARVPTVQWMERALSAWQLYRDEVAAACELQRGSAGEAIGKTS
jgi:hypothetical protein